MYASNNRTQRLLRSCFFYSQWVHLKWNYRALVVFRLHSFVSLPIYLPLPLSPLNHHSIHWMRWRTSYGWKLNFSFLFSFFVFFYSPIDFLTVFFQHDVGWTWSPLFHSIQTYCNRHPQHISFSIIITFAKYIQRIYICVQLIQYINSRQCAAESQHKPPLHTLLRLELDCNLCSV